VLPNLIRDVALLRSSDDGYLGAHCLPLRSQSNRSAYKEGFQTFVDDGARLYPQWMMCGMMYGLSSDLMRWLASPESLLARWQMHGHVRRCALAVKRDPFRVAQHPVFDLLLDVINVVSQRKVDSRTGPNSRIVFYVDMGTRFVSENA